VRASALVLALGPGLVSGAPAGAEECRLALVLGFDVSASVDAREYRLMMEGTAAALVSPPVSRAALADLPVAMAAYVWAGAREQAVVAGWTLIDGPEALARLAGRIAAFPRPDGDPLGPWRGRTGVGAALEAARSLLDRAPACDAQAVDLATDGENNDGPEPGPLRAVLFAGATVNALAVGGDLPLDHGTVFEEGGRLSAYLERHVIWGPGAFVESAVDYDDFERAMTRKLERELRPWLLGAADAPGTMPGRPPDCAAGGTAPARDGGMSLPNHRSDVCY
jgi:hypothetical protein